MHNIDNIDSNFPLAEESQLDIISINSVMSEEVSPNCLKSFALLSDHKHFYLTTCIGILHYFQLHLGTSHCSEFSNL